MRRFMRTYHVCAAAATQLDRPRTVLELRGKLQRETWRRASKRGKCCETRALDCDLAPGNQWRLSNVDRTVFRTYRTSNMQAQWASGPFRKCMDSDERRHGAKLMSFATRTSHAPRTSSATVLYSLVIRTRRHTRPWNARPFELFSRIVFVLRDATRIWILRVAI